MTELDDLGATVELLRSQGFEDLSPALVAEIISIEVDHVENRAPAARLVEAAVDKHLGAE
jgi:hypothetical protein